MMRTRGNHLDPVNRVIKGPECIRRVFLPGWIWILLPLACHWGFSWIGFNPTDEGWLQAIARRLINGEIPHRDFISIRPVLSAALQVPLVWVGGNHVLWLARLWGWLMAGGIAWLWSGFLLPKNTSAWLRLMLYAVIFFLNVHVFPVMAWHTLDGLLFASLSVALALRQTIPGWRGAFLFAGLATLCRQNFVFFIPFLCVGLPSLKHWRSIFWVLVPPVIYIAGLIYFGALADFVAQVRSSQGLLFTAALGRYALTPAFAWAVGVGILIGCALHYGRNTRPQTVFWVACIMIASTGIYAAFALSGGPEACTKSAFVLIGLTVALLLATWISVRPTKPVPFPIIAALGLAWTASISTGYNSPALMGGALLVGTWRLIELLSGHSLLVTRSGKSAAFLSLASLAMTFSHARLNFPYQERPANELHRDAGKVLHGAAGLWTDDITYAALKDLRGLTDRFEAKHQSYAILTDYSAVWILNQQRNPLPCEWPQTTERGSNAQFTRRVLRAMCSLPAGVPIIVQRHIISFASYGLFPVSLGHDYFQLQIWLSEHGQRVEQTPYFEVYLPPRWTEEFTINSP